MAIANLNQYRPSDEKAEEVADLEDDVVPALEHVVEIVRVDLD